MLITKHTALLNCEGRSWGSNARATRLPAPLAREQSLSSSNKLKPQVLTSPLQEAEVAGQMLPWKAFGQHPHSPRTNVDPAQPFCRDTVAQAM